MATIRQQLLFKVWHLPDIELLSRGSYTGGHSGCLGRQITFIIYRAHGYIRCQDRIIGLTWISENSFKKLPHEGDLTASIILNKWHHLVHVTADCWQVLKIQLHFSFLQIQIHIQHHTNIQYKLACLHVQYCIVTETLVVDKKLAKC